jgi:hypothetical protein
MLGRRSTGVCSTAGFGLGSNEREIMGDNGHESGSERFDRVERILLALAEDHQEFAREHKQLLTAQVVLTERVDTLADRMDKLAVAQLETQEKLDTLIAVVNRIVEGRKPDQSA